MTTPWKGFFSAAWAETAIKLVNTAAAAILKILFILVFPLLKAFDVAFLGEPL